MNEKNIYERVIKKFGIQYQMDLAIEEMSEATKAISKYKRTQFYNIKTPKYVGISKTKSLADITEEIADVYITLGQIVHHFNLDKDIEYQKEVKLERLVKHLDMIDKNGT